MVTDWREVRRIELRLRMKRRSKPRNSGLFLDALSSVALGFCPDDWSALDAKPMPRTKRPLADSRQHFDPNKTPWCYSDLRLNFLGRRDNLHHERWPERKRQILGPWSLVLQEILGRRVSHRSNQTKEGIVGGFDSNLFKTLGLLLMRGIMPGCPLLVEL